MNPAQLYEVLKRIPFMKLGHIDYIDELVDQVSDYKSKMQVTPFIQGNMGKYFNDNGFMGSYLSPIYENESYKLGDESENNIYNIGEAATTGKWPHFALQPLGKDCPLVRRVVDDILDTPASCRIAQQPPKTQMRWHWHYFIESMPNCREVVLHVPLVTHEDVVVKVKLNISEGEDKTFTQHFKRGELWYLNPYHWHTIENNSSIERQHIWMNAYLTQPDGSAMNPRMHQLLETKAKEYRGPFVGKRTINELERFYKIKESFAKEAN